MIKLGLSGTRYSGKDTICKLFKQISIPVFDADIILKFILKYDYVLLQKIKDKVGSKYFNNGLYNFNMLNSDALISDGVFNDVLDIVIPDILEAYQLFENKNKKSIYTIFHSSLLFDRMDIYNEMHYTISVYAPLTHRIERACQLVRDRSFDNQILINSILSSEKSELDKNKMATFTIHNYNEFDTLNQVNEIDKKLIDFYLKSLQNKTIKKDKLEAISDNSIKINLL